MCRCYERQRSTLIFVIKRKKRGLRREEVKGVGVMKDKDLRWFFLLQRTKGPEYIKKCPWLFIIRDHCKWVTSHGWGGKVEGVGVMKNRNLDRVCPRRCGSRIARPWTPRQRPHTRKKSSVRTTPHSRVTVRTRLFTEMCTTMNWSRRILHMGEGSVTG